MIERLAEIEKYNETNHIDRSTQVNGRALTNIGVFRAYITNYLNHHPGIHKGMTLMVRQLEPTEKGLPVELYCFTNTTDWENMKPFKGIFSIICLRLHQNLTCGFSKIRLDMILKV